MKKVFNILLIFVLIFSFSSGVSAISGREVMEKVNEGEGVESTHALLGMDLIDVDGNLKSRTLEIWSITRGEADLMNMVMEFRAPASVAGTRFLMVENKDRDDDQHIYLPSLGRVRRISSSQEDSTFMGSDFTYSDMSQLQSSDIDDDNHKLLREETLDDYECYVVESTPKNIEHSNYGRRNQWISKKHLMPIKVEIYNKTGELEKVLTVKQNIARIDGHWTPFWGKIENIETGHSTVLYVKQSDSGAAFIEYNKKINPNRFTPNFLKTGKF